MSNSIDAGIALYLFLAIGAIAFFTFLSVATWAGTRQAEREAYYKAEMMKKIAETPGANNPALEYLREQERIAEKKRIGGIKLGGLINVGAGIGIMIFLKALISWKPIYLTGAIILLVGLALLVYGFWIAPKEGA